MAVAALEALAILKDEPQRREKLARLVEHAGQQLHSCGLPGSGSQILPVVIGEDLAAMQFASSLRERGFDVRGVRPPTVPKGTARLRISITLNVVEADISSLFAALAELREMPA
jgi:8-amino-7-oxononanoate synthase